MSAPHCRAAVRPDSSSGFPWFGLFRGGFFLARGTGRSVAQPQGDRPRISPVRQKMCRTWRDRFALGAAYVFGQEAEGDGSRGQALEDGEALEGLDEGRHREGAVGLQDPGDYTSA